MRFVMGSERTFNYAMIAVLLVCCLYSLLSGWAAPPLWLIGALLAGSNIVMLGLVWRKKSAE